jgi:hypothetical protein
MIEVPLRDIVVYDDPTNMAALVLEQLKPQHLQLRDLLK